MIFFTRHRNLFILHFTVLIWGFTGVLGSLISTPALQLVWYRVLIAALTLIGYHFIMRKEMLVPTKDILKFMGVGLLVGLHWVLFFQAIKVSTVSVTLVTLSSLTLFTSILEPLFYRRKMSIGDILVGVVIIFGIYLIFKFEFKYWLGISLGLGAALCASVFSILNGQMVQKTSPSIITQYEMIGAFIGVSLVLLFTGQFDENMLLSSSDFFYLFVLGSICTALAYVLGVAVMKELSAFTVALVTNLEPVYGIVLAFFFIGSTEKMSVGFYAGAIIILGAVFVYPTLKTKLLNLKAAA
ncbi:DMT family transporter [Sphingobacterium bovistauri]|uniref:DMT family transporter n=1 Tax=Sphingobacterium bovistauri TaxID=2781959 RepID=A0ABS7Z8D5_9SPHI|nr:DMT family transporter [Sphingobacterium bovistauri]MCA5006456.1 DMT family transporter [Sphingobacterium bovistauri]